MQGLSVPQFPFAPAAREGPRDLPASRVPGGDALKRGGCRRRGEAAGGEAGGGFPALEPPQRGRTDAGLRAAGLGLGWGSGALEHTHPSVPRQSEARPGDAEPHQGAVGSGAGRVGAGAPSPPRGRGARCPLPLCAREMGLGNVGSSGAPRAHPQGHNHAAGGAVGGRLGVLPFQGGLLEGRFARRALGLCAAGGACTRPSLKH